MYRVKVDGANKVTQTRKLSESASHNIPADLLPVVGSPPAGGSFNGGDYDPISQTVSNVPPEPVKRREELANKVGLLTAGEQSDALKILLGNIDPQ